VSGRGISQIPGAEGWSYGAFAHDEASGLIRIPVIREADGKEASFALPDFVNDAEEIATVARVVAAAVERWERVEGLGA
jgi:hypothetical protein